MTCREATLSLGAYLVGSLDPRERAAVDEHLAGCATCRDELGRLAPLPGLMSRLSLDEVLAGPPPVDDAMLERLLRAAHDDRRRSARRRLVAVAAAVVLLAGGSVAGVAGWQAGHQQHWQQVVAARGPVHMRVELQPASTGTGLQLRLTGVPAGERCRLVAVSDAGARDVAGSWTATYSGTATITGTTSIPRDRLHRLVVQTYDGRTLLAADVPAAT